MPVRITDLITSEVTIDHEIRQRVKFKQEMADLVLDVRKILSRVFDLSKDDDEGEEPEEAE